MLIWTYITSAKGVKHKMQSHPKYSCVSGIPIARSAQTENAKSSIDMRLAAIATRTRTPADRLLAPD